MTNKIFITIEFVNDKGELKKVTFPFDEQYYKDLFDESISEEQRNEILLYEYRMYCSDRKYQRKHRPFFDNDKFDVECKEADPCEKLIKSDEENRNKLQLELWLNQLKPRHKEAITLVYIEGLKQREAMVIMNMKEAAFSRLLKRAESALEEIIGKKIFNILKKM